MKNFNVIIIGGSYSGLAAAMALGRALKTVLVMDSGKPCNAQTPYSHNFLTQDGSTPSEIAMQAKRQVEKYDTIKFLNAIAIKGSKNEDGFTIEVSTGDIFTSQKLIFATGIRDILPDIEGFSASWGISILHCPYCHGYEVKDLCTGTLGNGDIGFELAMLISNWTKKLTLFTNGVSTLTENQIRKLDKHHIKIQQTEIEYFENTNGYLDSIHFQNGNSFAVSAIYTKLPFVQSSFIPESLGCKLTEEGYIQVDAFQQTTVDDIYACGDNVSRLRTVAGAVAMGTTAGMSLSKKMIMDDFL